MQSLIDLFGIKDFIPHGYCLSWSPVLLWLHVISDILITLAYYSIPLILVYFIRQRKDLPYPGLVVMFAGFIVACGTTHLLSAITIWIPLYWLDGWIKGFTAVLSVTTAVLMLWIVPRALALPSAAQLQAEIQQRKIAETAQQETLDRLHKIADQLPGVVFQFRLYADGSSCLPYASDRLRDLYRINPEDVCDDAAKVFAVVHPDDLDKHLASIQASAHDLSPWRNEYRLKFVDGTERWLFGNALPQREEDGSVLWHGFVTDITERKQAEEIIQVAAQYARSLIEASLDPLVTISAEGKIADVNVATERVTGINRDNLIGSDFADYFTDPEQAREGYKQVFSQGFVTNYPLAIRHVSGKITNVLYNASVYCDNKGNVLGAFAAARDISDSEQIERALRISEDHFKTMFNEAPLGIALIDSLTGQLYSVNPMFAKIAGRTIEEMTHIDWMSITHPDDVQEDLDNMALLNAGKISGFQMEKRYLHHDGTSVWINMTIAPINVEDKTHPRHLCMIEDITERKLAEESLRKLSWAVEQSPNLVMITDLNAHIEYVNETFVKITGYSRDEVIGKNPRLLCSGKTPRETHEDMWATLNAGNVWKGELFNKTKVGVEYTESALISPVRQSNGKITHYVGIKEDITARKQVEDDRNLLLKIIEEAPDFIATADMQAHLKYLNPAAAKLIGLPVDADLSVLSIKDVHPNWAAIRVLAEGIPTVLKQGFWQSETALLHRDGHEIPVSQLLLLHRDASGNPVLLSTIMRDITVNKQAEQALRQAKEAAESLTQSKSEFIANMSHEIRTPMNAIMGLSYLALNKELSFEIRDYLQKIYNSSNNLLSILNDILDFSRLEAGHLIIDHSPFDLNEMLDNISNLFADRAKEKCIDFNIDIAPDVPRGLIGDTLRLQQILINLLGNAIKFTARGKVTLRITAQQLDPSQARLLFCVMDTGIGISIADREKLFKPFSQVDGSITRRFGGTGLGLAISQNLLQLMNSEFSIDSSPDKGSCFNFELVFGVSASSSQCMVEHKSETPILAQGDFSKLFSGTKILVAEDNSINQQVIREFLNLSGITVKIVNNGKEAIELLENNLFDAVLMDIHMPEMDGFEATKLIRSQARFAGLPVIALTAGVTKDEQDKCMASGMNDFIAKPINPKQLMSTLVQWIKPIGATAIEITNAEPIAVNLSNMDGLPGFDLHNLLVMLGNNQELAVQFLLSFMENMKNLPSEIEAMMADGNIVATRELVHKIKGASGNIGAMRLHAASDALEAELKKGGSTAVGFNTFQEAFNQTMSVIAALPQPRNQRLPISGNIEELKRTAAELDLLLKNNDFIPETLLNTLKSHLALDQLDLFAQLRMLTNNLEYNEARNSLRQLVDLPDLG